MDKHIVWMYRYYGRSHGFRCRECCNYYHKRFDKVYRKCRAWGDSKGPGTDWVGSWEACGLFGIPFDIRLCRLGSEIKAACGRRGGDPGPVEGQVALELD